MGVIVAPISEVAFLMVGNLYINLIKHKVNLVDLFIKHSKLMMEVNVMLVISLVMVVVLL